VTLAATDSFQLVDLTNINKYKKHGIFLNEKKSRSVNLLLILIGGVHYRRSQSTQDLSGLIAVDIQYYLLL
jgi:hypothetical protein